MRYLRVLKDGIIYYVGKSIKIGIRIKQHCNYKHNLEYVVLEICEEYMLYERERYWIKHLADKGLNLTNKHGLCNRHVPAKYL